MRNIKLSSFKRILMTVLVFLLNVTYHTNLSAARCSSNHNSLQGSEIVCMPAYVVKYCSSDFDCTSSGYLCLTQSEYSIYSMLSVTGFSCGAEYTGATGTICFGGGMVPYNDNCSCMPGYYYSGQTDQCIICPKGHRCGGGISMDQSPSTESGKYPCYSGKYQNEEGQSSCKSCPPGTYTSDHGIMDVTGYSTCTCCAMGHYASGDGNTTCTSAQPGQYVSGSCMSSPMPCPSGTYMPNSGYYACWSCASSTNGTVATAIVGAYGAKSETECYLDVKTYEESDTTGKWKNSTACYYK